LGNDLPSFSSLVAYLLREIGWGSGDWIDLAEDWDQWRALVRAVMNLQVP
jgi:hypothetical protein